MGTVIESYNYFYWLSLKHDNTLLSTIPTILLLELYAYTLANDTSIFFFYMLDTTSIEIVIYVEFFNFIKKLTLIYSLILFESLIKELNSFTRYCGSLVAYDQ